MGIVRKEQKISKLHLYDNEIAVEIGEEIGTYCSFIVFLKLI